MSKPVLAYWDIRGLAEPVRLMLQHSGVNYEDKRYVCGDAPDYDRSSWTNVKNTIGLDFANLPYYIDGDVKLTESFAIMKYIGRKNGLVPVTEEEMYRADMSEGVISDFRKSFTMMCYMPDHEKRKANFFDQLPGKLVLFEKFLNEKTWLAGDKLTYVDFAMCEILDHICMMEPTSLDKHEKVKKYYEKFFKLEKVAEYRKSSAFKKLPVNNKMANWGGSSE
uniref:glutathione S-transferase Mu 3-like n=1 Tax=Ciona intestinalis TaxID=7719 RepID=UPI000180C76C|nr:glutathione S-transferase Mu 3-like [Ciona intestinalis]|eukprot:XP_009862354.1 glutathione S-transferase Mu 3-like [Ciona intestinalis]